MPACSIFQASAGRGRASLRELLTAAYTEVRLPWRLMLPCGVALALIFPWPADLREYRATPPDRSLLVFMTEHHLRFVNTATQVVMPILMRDPVGMVQFLYVAGATTAATQGLKFLLDSQTIGGVRLGERPVRSASRHNMPSGHSSMASSGAYAVARRYGWWHLLYLVPVLLLTMYARVVLDAHTVPAVLAGALLGILTAMAFTGEWRARGRA